MRYDDLLSDAKKEPLWVWTSGEDNTKPARSPVGKVPPISSGLEQQSRVSSALFLFVTLEGCLSTQMAPVQ